MPTPGGCAPAGCASARRPWRSLAGSSSRGRPIPTLASVLALVAGRVPLLLEVKTDRDLWRWVPALRRELAGYHGRFGVMSFDPRIPRLLKTHMPEVRRGLILRASTPPLRRRLFLRLADPDFLAVQLAALNQPWVPKARRGRPPLYLDRQDRSRPRASPGSGRCPHLGSRWPTVKSEILAKIASGVSGLNAAAWDRLAGDHPFVGHAFL